MGSCRRGVSNRQITSWSVPAIPVSHYSAANPKAGIAGVLADKRLNSNLRDRGYSATERSHAIRKRWATKQTGKIGLVNMDASSAV